MSIADKLTKLESDIGDAYDAVEAKGGTIPLNKNTNNLSAAISSISGTEDLSTELNAQDNALATQQTKISQAMAALNSKAAVSLTAMTSDATATASDIVTGKTAYVNGQKITGNYTSTFVVPNGMKFRSSSVLPNSIDTSGVTDMKLMFADSTLTQIPQIDTSSATDMSACFANSEQLISLPQMDTSKVTNMQSFCANTSSLTNVPEFDLSSIYESSSSKNYGMNLFYNSISLSNESLNNILASLKTIRVYRSHKNLKYIGLSSTQATTCTSLSNWTALSTSGWTTGY